MSHPEGAVVSPVLTFPDAMYYAQQLPGQRALTMEDRSQKPPGPLRVNTRPPPAESVTRCVTP